MGAELACWKEISIQILTA